MPDIDRVNLDNNTTYDIISKTGRGLVRATMNDSTSTSTAFVVTADSGIESLYDGLTIVCKNTKVASASGCTIDLNGLGAKRIWVSQGNGYCTTHWGLNATYIFIYDATNERWELQQGRDTNDNDTYTISEYYKHVIAGTNGIKKYSLFAATGENSYTSFTTNDGTGAKTFDTTTEFDISKLYYFNSGTTIAANATTADNTIRYCGVNADMRYSFTGVTTSSSTSSLTANKPVYLVVTPTKGNYGKVTSPYFIQDIATDGVTGVIYVRVGWMRNSYYCDLEPENKAYIKWVNPDDNTDIRILDWISGTINAAIINSHGYAEGLNTIASGSLTSHAEGRLATASGIVSHAEGYKTLASGVMTHAEGSVTEASGSVSHAEGTQTIASGSNSHAEGIRTTSSGSHSHAEGRDGTATGDQSHAEGYNGKANAPTSHVEGYECTAYADNSHAEGGHTSTGVNDSYQTFNSHAEGNNTLVTGNDSHAEGYCSIAGFGGIDTTIDNYIFKGYWVSGSNYAKGDYVVSSSDHNFYVCHTAITTSTTDPSEDENLDNWYLLREFGIIELYTHAEGCATISGGNSSHSEGKYTRAFGDESHAEGLGTIAAGDYQHTGGKYNVADANSTYAEIIGNGTSDSNRSNARTLDWNGNESLLGNLKFMECDSTTQLTDYPVNMIEPGITWKERGYGDKFEIKPKFYGVNDENKLMVNASYGAAGTDPDVATVMHIDPLGDFGFGREVYETWWNFNCTSSTNNVKIKITFPNNNWAKYYVDVFATANFGYIHSRVFVGMNDQNSINQCGYTNETPTWTTVSGCSAVTNNTALTWTADKTNRIITSSAFGKYGMAMVRITSSVNPIYNRIKVERIDG